MMLLVSSILALIVTVNVQSAAIGSPLNVLTLNDLSPGDREYLQNLQNERAKRSGGGDILGSVKAKLTQGLKSKLSGIASASSHASSFLSGGSKHFHDYGTPSHDEKSFSFWDLQKSIFHTLLQAAKAIKGGLLAIKGQLIKGSGYVISAKGKLISAKGEAISNIGKHLASTAVLVQRPFSHYSAPSAPVEPVYPEPPLSSGYGDDSSGSGVEYHSHHYDPIPSGLDQHKYPTNFEEYKDHQPKPTNQGILIIKKIPKVKKGEHSNGNNAVHISQEKHKPVVESEGPQFPFPSDFKIPSYDSDTHNPEETTPPSHSFEHNYQSHDQPPTSQHFDTLASYEPPTPPHTHNDIPHNFNLFTPHNQDLLGKLETYEPFSLPSQNQKPLSVELPSYTNINQKYPHTIKGYESFPPYPVDLHKSFDSEAQYSTLNTQKLLPPSLKHNASKNQTRIKQPLHTKSISRRKQQPNNKSVYVWLRP